MLYATDEAELQNIDNRVYFLLYNIHIIVM